MSATLPPLKRVLATPSVWIQAASKAAASTFPQLKGNGGHPTFDVAVVGAGIFGINCALKLHRAGKKVVVLEGRRIGMGTTGTSTSKFTSQQNVIYSKLAKMHGHEIAKQYGTMQENAIREIYDIVNTYKLDCDMSCCAHTTWTSQDSYVSTIKQEYEEAIKCGLPAEYITDPTKVELPASVGMKAAVRFSGQLQLNAYAYCVELAKVLNGMGVPIYEESRVTEVSSDTPHRVSTEQGHVEADHVILATHMPILDRSCHFAFLPPSRSFCIAVKLKSPEEKTSTYEPAPSANSIHDMYISVDQPMRSLRPGTSQHDDILVVAGESIEVGNMNKSPSEEHYENLEKWVREHYKVESIIARWSAMDYFSSDLLPYIGYLYRGTETIYTSTGQSKWGLLNGIAGAGIVTDLIMKKQNSFASMVDARRWDLLKQAPGFVAENIQTTKHFIGDKLAAMVAPDIKTLRTGEGGIVKKDGQTIGAFLDQHGTYHVVKPICTHLGCHLMFNQGDGVWDCPCHGSQFSVDGEVLHGPACKNLLKPEMTW